MAKVTYNGVEFTNVLTHSVQVEPVRDPSGTDYQYTRYTLRVQSLFSRTAAYIDDDESQPIPPMNLKGFGTEDGPEEDEQEVEMFGDAFERIEEKLRTPRRGLLYSVDEDETPLIHVPGSADAFVADLANGPKPELLTIRDVSPSVVFVDWQVVACLRTDCDAAPAPSGGPYWVSHRWEETTDIRENWLTRVVRTGTVVIPTATDPELLRAAVTPDVRPGFRRSAAKYAVSRDGLQVDYAFTDEELMRVPPVPLIRLYCQQDMGTAHFGGAIRYGRIELRGVGAKTTTAAEILAALVLIAMKRAMAAGAGNSTKTGRVLSKGSIREIADDDKNEVVLTFEFKSSVTNERGATGVGQGVKAAGKAIAGAIGGAFLGAGGSVFVPLLLGGTKTAAEAGPWLNGANPPPSPPAPQPNEQGKDKAGLPLTLDWLGQPLAGSNPTRGIAPPTRGTAETVKLAAAVLNDPCGKTAVLRTTTLSNKLIGTAAGGSTVEAYTPPYPDDYEALYDDGGSPGIYDQFQCSSHYTDDPGVRVVPSTKDGEVAQKVRVTNPLRKLVCEWYVKRTGGPPVLPDITAAAQTGSGENWVFVKGTTTLNEMAVAGDGVTPVYESAGVFEFTALNYALTILAAPVPPFLGAVAQSAANNHPMLGLAAAATALPRGRNILFPVATPGVPPPPGTSPPPPPFPTSPPPPPGPPPVNP